MSELGAKGRNAVTDVPSETELAGGVRQLKCAVWMRIMGQEAAFTLKYDGHCFHQVGESHTKSSPSKPIQLLPGI